MNSVDPKLVRDVRHAILSGHKANLKTLLPKAKPNEWILDRSGWTLAHEAAMNGTLEVVEEVLNYCPAQINARNSRHETPLMFAVWRADVHLIKAFLERGADPTAVSIIGSVSKNPENENDENENPGTIVRIEKHVVEWIPNWLDDEARAKIVALLQRENLRDQSNLRIVG